MDAQKVALELTLKAIPNLPIMRARTRTPEAMGSAIADLFNAIAAHIETTRGDWPYLPPAEVKRQLEELGLIPRTVPDAQE